MQQRSLEWYMARLGKVTASSVYKLSPTTKQYQTYKNEIVTETIIKFCEPENIENIMYHLRPPVNKYMQWGIENEEMAKTAYAIATDNTVENCGFILHPTLSRAGASPDGLINDDGLVEIKCPATQTHMRFVVDQKIDSQYYAQMQFQMACTGRQWCDFVSYDPRLSSLNISMQIVRVTRDHEFIEQLEQRVVDFIAEVDKDLQIICERNNIPIDLNKL